jgi:hypothetical protein
MTRRPSTTRSRIKNQATTTSAVNGIRLVATSKPLGLDRQAKLFAGIEPALAIGFLFTSSATIATVASAVLVRKPVLTDRTLLSLRGVVDRLG